jgi:hypothetical protein
MRRLLLLLALPLAAQTQPWAVTRAGYAPWQAADKRAHFQTGAVGGFMEAAVLEGFKVKHPYRWIIATGLVVGFSKELWDRTHKGSPETMDALNTAAGFAVGGLPVLVRWGKGTETKVTVGRR